MAGDLVIEEGDLEVLRDRTRDLSSRLQSVTVATAGDYISSAVGGKPARRTGTQRRRDDRRGGHCTDP